MAIAHSLPTGSGRRQRFAETVTFEGVNYPLIFQTGKGWRLRSRSAHHPVDFATGTTIKTIAKRLAREFLARRKSSATKPSARTLEDVVTAYRAMPKRASAKTEKLNIQMLRAIVRETLGKELSAVRASEIGPRLWDRFQARRQQRDHPDLATRRPQNVTINSALRAALSIFIAKLRPQYAALGIHIPDNACAVQWLKEIRRKPAAYDDAAMINAWAVLQDRALWFAVGLARFAGLRRSEIAACRSSWLVDNDGVWCIELRDRPDDNFLTKTGEHYFAPLLRVELIEALRMLPPEKLAVDQTRNWMTRRAQIWLRQFMPDLRAIPKPLHRLRKAYLHDVHRSAMLAAQREALARSAEAAGHTSTTTTRRHYLPAQMTG